MLTHALAIAALVVQPPAGAVEPPVAPRDAPSVESAALAEARPDIPQVDAYEPRTIAGFRVLVHRLLLGDRELDGRRVIAALTWDLELAAERLPAPAIAMLRRTTPIWITPDLPSAGGWAARGLCHHPSRAWLVDAGYGPDRVGSIEVCDVSEYLLWRAEQPLCVLHEMAHAIQHELGDPPEIRAAFDAAVASGVYEEVPFVLLQEGRTRRAYALNNHIEYFAEISEACFGRNDYYPFTREDLRAVDAEGLAMVERVWAMPGSVQAPGAANGP